MLMSIKENIFGHKPGLIHGIKGWGRRLGTVECVTTENRLSGWSINKDAGREGVPSLANGTEIILLLMGRL